MFMNGSNSHAALPTRLSLEEIGNIVLLKLNNNPKQPRQGKGSAAKQLQPQSQWQQELSSVAVGQGV
jgi:hypothetical protein